MKQVNSISEARNFVNVLRYRAACQPEKCAFNYLQSEGRQELKTTYQQLDKRARAIAGELQKVANAGDRALLLFPSGLEYIAAFMGCLYAGIVAVPSYPPKKSQRRNPTHRVQTLARDAQPTVLMTTIELQSEMDELQWDDDTVHPCVIFTDTITDEQSIHWQEKEIAPESLAFLQYTSGSTSSPKGVMVSHANLLHNEEHIRDAFGQNSNSVIVSWLPLYHDMGLIGSVLQTIYVGATCILLSPIDFLRNPMLWLETISRFRATTSGGPDFSYDLCVKKIRPEQRKTLDLTNWEVAFNGAEPIRYDTLLNFAEAFAECGFKLHAFRPCYGLAEATLLVTAGDGSDLVFSKQHGLTEEGLGNSSRTLVGSGKISRGLEVAIVNPETFERCPDNETGEVWISSPSVACGYWNREEETKATFRAYIKDGPCNTYLRTGDLGFKRDQQLFVVGRLKDLIIVRGRNFYPDDLELIAQGCHEGLRKGCGAAFSVQGDHSERVVLAQEVARTVDIGDAETVAGMIRKCISMEFDLYIDEIVFVKEASLPRTSSGKLQRHLCRKQFLNRELSTIANNAFNQPHENVQCTHVISHVIKTLPKEQQQQWTEAYLKASIAQILRRPTPILDSSAPVALLGLDSLMVLELQNKIESDFGVRTPTDQILEGCSLEQLATMLLKELEWGAVALPVKKGKISPEFGLSHGQKALWFLHQLAPESAAYNIARAARITGTLDRTAMERAFTALVQRHPSLRTTFHTEGGPIQRVHDDLSASFAIEKIADDEKELEQRLFAEAQKPFDLSSGPVVQARLFEISDQEQVLLLVVHHIVSDLWSLVIMLRELVALYQAEVDGREASLPELRFNYSDYVAWQAEMLDGKEGAELSAYWQKHLAGQTLGLDLPCDYSRPAVKSFKGDLFRSSINANLTRRLKKVAEEKGTTVYMVLLAAFYILLHRYANSSDIPLLSLATGRTRQAFADLVGYMVNPLLLKATVDEGMGFEDFLYQVRETVAGGFQHQNYPYPVLVNELREQRSQQSGTAEVAFTLQKTIHEDEGWSLYALGDSGTTLQFGSLVLESVVIPQATSQFDLLLAAAESNDGIMFAWEYSTDLFRSATIARMGSHLEKLLEEIGNNSSQKISQLGMLREEERDQILTTWNDTSTSYGAGYRLHELFEMQAAKTPRAIALLYGTQQVSYRELNHTCNELARELLKNGLQQGEVVGVCAERSLSMVFALLSILKAGGAYLPLEPSHPEERLSVMIQDAKVQLVLTRPEWQAQLPPDVVKIPLPEKENKISDASNPGLKIAAKDLSYVIYTSGSTGRPKGVMVSHESIVNRLQWMQKEYQLTAYDVVLQKTPFSFDVSVWEFFWPLITGCKLVVAAPGEHRDNQRLVQIVEEHGVTTVHFVPSMLQAFLQSPDLHRCKSLQRVICSGEALSRELVRSCFQQLPWAGIHNLYGPTEAAVDVTSWACKTSETAHAVPIGRPISNIQVYVLDDYMNPVPSGIAGELYLGGKGLARGYCSRAGLSAEKFVPNPFGVGSRLYRTGDLAKFRADGVIEFLGRIDYQVKIRGFRVEPAEIESALCKHPSVKECAVLARKVAEEHRLACYVVLNEQEKTSVSELRQFIKRELPEYMVPANFVFLAHLPLSSNGKLDRKALPGVDNARPKLEAAYVPAQTWEEEILISIWEQILCVEKVGIHDNYFDLGGDSIRSIQVVALARERGLDLQLQEILQYQTVHQMAAIAREKSTIPEIPRIKPFDLISKEDCLLLPMDIEDAYPLSELQAGLVFHSGSRSDYVVYSVSAHLRAPFDAVKMQTALAIMVARHELLRTRYDMATLSRPVQIVQRTAQIPFEVKDLRSLASEEQEHSIKAWLEGEKKTRFDWTTAPFLRVTIHRRTDESFQFTYTHPLFDGWSTASLITEFCVTYFDLIKGREVEQRPLTSSYREFIALELQSQQEEKSLNYWKDQLEDCPNTMLALPCYSRRNPDELPVRVTREIPERVFAGLRQLAHEASVPIKSVFLAAHMRAVSLMTGTQDIMTGLICNGRPDHTDGEKVPGLFLNTPPLRMSLKGGTWQELVKRTFEAEREMLPFRRYPYSRIQRSKGSHPLFDTAFNLINFHVYKGIQQIPEMELIERYTSYDQTFFPMTAYFELDIFSSRALFHIDLSVETLDDNQLATIAGYYMKIMEQMAEFPRERYDAKHFLGDAEAEKMLVEWNSTQAAPAAYKNIQEAIAEWGHRSPGRIAISDEHEDISYGDLNLRADNLADYLRSMRAGPEVVVGVCLEPSVELVIALLAVLKAGCAYLPLDPSLPRQRLAWMLQDSRAALLITRESLGLNVSGLPIVPMDREEKWIAAGTKQYTSRQVRGENLAYVIYTSGSTGEPKGVAVPHKGLMNLVEWHQKTYAVTPKDRATQLARLSFDACVWELWPYLASGASVHFPPAGTLDLPARLVEWLTEKEITISFLPTPLAEAALQEKWPENGQLRALLTGGDKLHKGAGDDVPINLFNHYGPTENTVVSTSTKVDQNEHDGAAPPIGRPISGNQAYVLDAAMQPVPTGVVGELYVGGDSLARGYLFRAGLTAERFIPNPFGKSGQRLYKTGDLVRYLRNGDLDFIGRNDHQVKIRGLRIEMGEIEANLLGYPGICQAAVVLYQQPMQHLASFIVTQDGEPIASAALREYLLERVPQYMVPSSFTFLAELPLTHNGKVNKKELLSYATMQSVPTESFVAPRTPLESQVAEIWSRTLGRENIGIHNNFFELGGHSLTATQIISRVSAELGVGVSLRSFFERPTVEGMAAVIEMKQNESQGEELDQILEEIDGLSDEEVMQRIVIHSSHTDLV